jgi:hypothetical protein
MTECYDNDIKYVKLDSCPRRSKQHKEPELVSTITPRENSSSQNNQSVGEEFSILKFMRQLNGTETQHNKNTYESTKCIIAIICLFCIV